MSDSVEAKIGTSLSIPLLAAADRALGDAQTVTHWGDELQPSIVAILCAGTAVEAATNWAASALAPEWFATHEEDRPVSKWADLLDHLTGDRPDMSQGLGQRVAELFDDRNWIAHDRGVKGRDGKRVFFIEPDPKTGNRSAVRTHFTAERATGHLATAKEAIDRLPKV